MTSSSFVSELHAQGWLWIIPDGDRSLGHDRLKNCLRECFFVLFERVRVQCEQ